MDLQSSPSTATLRTALDVPEGTLIGNHHRVLIQRTRGLIHTVKFVSKPRPGTCVAFAFGLSNDPVYKTIAQDFGRKVFAGKHCRMDDPPSSTGDRSSQNRVARSVLFRLRLETHRD